MPPYPKPPRREKKQPKPLKRSWIKSKPVHERRKMVPTNRTLLEAELDRLCSVYVRRRDAKCITCGTDKNLTCSHFVKRVYQEVRYDVKANLNCQCKQCNENHNADESAYMAYMVGKYGYTVINSLYGATKRTSFKWSIPELREKLAELTELVGEG